jgi:Xaa-Pro aminopeptidase
VFDIVRDARDAAVAFARGRLAAGEPVYGYEVDDAARGVIAAAGFGPRFIHRTGHSIGTTGHGNGVNIDNLETQDRRRLIPGVGFSIEPGIYLPDEQIGVRLEIDCYVAGDELEVTTLPLQDAIVLV